MDIIYQYKPTDAAGFTLRAPHTAQAHVPRVGEWWRGMTPTRYIVRDVIWAPWGDGEHTTAHVRVMLGEA